MRGCLRVRDDECVLKRLDVGEDVRMCVREMNDVRCMRICVFTCEGLCA